MFKETTSRIVRAKIAQLLSSRRDIPWTLKDDGTVDINSSPVKCGTLWRLTWELEATRQRGSDNTGR